MLCSVYTLKVWQPAAVGFGDLEFSLRCRWADTKLTISYCSLHLSQESTFVLKQTFVWNQIPEISFLDICLVYESSDYSAELFPATPSLPHPLTFGIFVLVNKIGR